MLLLKSYFTIYVDILMLIIGWYMAFVQSSNLISDKLEREGRFSRTIGYVYLVIGVIGILICII